MLPKVCNLQKFELKTKSLCFYSHILKNNFVHQPTQTENIFAWFSLVKEKHCVFLCSVLKYLVLTV